MNMYQIRMIRERNAKLPYTVALLLVFWVSFLMGMKAHADDRVETCRAFADIAYQMAKKRDEGWTVFDIRGFIYENFDQSIHRPSVALAQIVFEKPWGSPSKEAEQFLGECFKMIGVSGTTL